ncbi:MAG: alpha-L-fucosidase [Chitinophagaceae bacterium]
MKKTSLLLITFLVLQFQGNAQNVETIITTKKDDPKMLWWRDAKFGMFIHWGIYAQTAGKWGDKTNYGEWIMHSAKIPRATYAGLAKQFNPTKFNAEEWVKLAKAAGQKYIVITSKHHDGFAMYASKASDYNIVDATPFKRDILKELADACRKQNMKLGFYYSQAQDWYHKGGAISGGKEWDTTHIGNMDSYIDSIAVPQVREILKNYGDVAVLWWDTPTNMTKEMSVKLANELKPYPNIISNNRLGAGLGGDLETPEQFIPATGFPGRNWEVCMTMNGQWGYNAYDDNWKSTKDLLQKLIDIVSKGGNFLLNVGPNQYGIIPEVCQRSLTEIGDWLLINGEAIYGTTANPFPYLAYGRATRKNQTVYLHVFNWPTNKKLNVPFTNKITKAYLLADRNTLLKVTSIKGNNVVDVPSYAPDKVASVIAIEFESEPNVLPIPTNNKLPVVSSIDSTTNIASLTDGDPNTKWKATKGRKTATIEIDLGANYMIESMALVEPWHPWSNIKQAHELQYWDGKNWNTIIKGRTNGIGCTTQFNKVSVRKCRLIVENEKEAPSISEFILFRSE